MNSDKDLEKEFEFFRRNGNSNRKRNIILEEDKDNDDYIEYEKINIKYHEDISSNLNDSYEETYL